MLDKVGHFLLEDPMTQVNLNFTQDVCYEAMGHLMASIRSGTPEGLKVFGDWPSVKAIGMVISVRQEGDEGF